jgi:preprotein translocase subunit YajC
MTAPPALALSLLFAPSPQNPLIGNLVMFALIFGIFCFLMIAPQQKQRRQHEDSLRNIKKGDEVVTAGGIIGTVIHIREGMKDGERVATMEDRIVIKSGESRLEVERGRIARVTSRTGEPSSAS